MAQCSDGSWCCGGVNVTCCNLKQGITLLATIGATVTGSTSSLSSQTSIPTSTSSNLSSNLDTNAPAPKQDDELSKAAKIGIGIGIAACVLAMAAILLTCVLLKRRQAQDHHGRDRIYSGNPLEVFYHEAPESKLRLVQAPVARVKPVEVPASVRQCELPG